MQNKGDSLTVNPTEIWKRSFSVGWTDYPSPSTGFGTISVVLWSTAKKLTFPAIGTYS
jgi:hypothetical protein